MSSKKTNVQMTNHHAKKRSPLGDLHWENANQNKNETLFHPH